jgi:hypothetical protein
VVATQTIIYTRPGDQGRRGGPSGWEFRVNIGCGQSPTPRWHNYDNSPAILIGQSRLAAGALRVLRLLNAGNLSYIDYCRRNDIKYADAMKCIPYGDGSVR